MNNDAALVTQLTIESKVLPLPANLNESRVEVVRAEAVLDALRDAVELASTEHEYLAKVREERQDEVESRKFMKSRSFATLVKQRGERSAGVNQLRSERNSAAAGDHQLLAPFVALPGRAKSESMRRPTILKCCVKITTVNVRLFWTLTWRNGVVLENNCRH